MPEGFEKQLGPEGLADVLEFLTQPAPPAGNGTPR
jgi:hypothetical protein